MRLRRRRTQQVQPVHSDRDDQGRLYDGDTVRPAGWPGWDAALAARPTRDPAVQALTEHTQILPTYPLLTPGQRWRGQGGGWR